MAATPPAVVTIARSDEDEYLPQSADPDDDGYDVAALERAVVDAVRSVWPQAAAVVDTPDEYVLRKVAERESMSFAKRGVADHRAQGKGVLLVGRR